MATTGPPWPRGPKAASGAEEKQGYEEEPEAVHEVPVVGGNFGGDGKRQSAGLAEVAKQDVEQGENSADQMHGVRGREDIEEAARCVGPDVEAHVHKVAPRDDLTDQKGDAERGGRAPHRLKTKQIVQSEP